MIPYLHLFFCEKNTYFLELIVLILLKINLSVRNIFFTNDEHVLVSNL